MAEPQQAQQAGLAVPVGVCEHGPVLNLQSLLQLNARIRILAGNGKTYMLIKTSRGGLQLMAEAK